MSRMQCHVKLLGGGGERDRTAETRHYMQAASKRAKMSTPSDEELLLAVLQVYAYDDVMHEARHRPTSYACMLGKRRNNDVAAPAPAPQPTHPSYLPPSA
jgi:hypothetical protein